MLNPNITLMMDEKERQRMIAELEGRMPGFKNPMVRIALDKQVKQMQELQKQIGKKRVQDAFDSQPLNQDQHDYIYLRMAWL